MAQTQASCCRHLLCAVWRTETPANLTPASTLTNPGPAPLRTSAWRRQEEVPATSLPLTALDQKELSGFYSSRILVCPARPSIRVTFTTPTYRRTHSQVGWADRSRCAASSTAISWMLRWPAMAKPTLIRSATGSTPATVLSSMAPYMVEQYRSRLRCCCWVQARSARLELLAAAFWSRPFVRSTGRLS